MKAASVWLWLVLMTTGLGAAKNLFLNGNLDSPSADGRLPAHWTVPADIQAEYQERTRYNTDHLLRVSRGSAGSLLEQTLRQTITGISELQLSFEVKNLGESAELSAEFTWQDTADKVFHTTVSLPEAKEWRIPCPPGVRQLRQFRLLCSGTAKLAVDCFLLRPVSEVMFPPLTRRSAAPSGTGVLASLPVLPCRLSVGKDMRILLVVTAGQSIVDLLAHDLERQFGVTVDVILGNQTYEPEQVRKHWLSREYVLLMVGFNLERMLANATNPYMAYLRQGGKGILLDSPSDFSFGTSMWKNGTTKHAHPVIREMPMAVLSPPEIQRWGIQSISQGKIGRGTAVHVVMRDRIYYRHGLWPAVDEEYLAVHTGNLHEQMGFNWYDYYTSLYMKLLLWADGQWQPTPTMTSDGQYVTVTDINHDSYRLMLCDERGQTLTLKPKQGTCSIPHTLPGGRYFMTLQRLDQRGNVLAWRTEVMQRTLSQVPEIQALTAINRRFRPGESPRLEVALTSQAPAGTQAHVTVTDAAERLLHDSRQPIGGCRKSTFDISLPAPMIQLPTVTVSVQLEHQGAKSGQRRLLCYVNGTENRMRYIAAGYLWIPLQYRQIYLDVFRELGLNTVNTWIPGAHNAGENGFSWTDGWGGVPVAAEYILASLQEQGIHGRKSYFNDPVRKHWRNGCLNDPQWQITMKKTVECYATLTANNPPYCWALTDEMTLAAPWSNHHPADSEPCRREGCLKAFRNLMREKYKTVESLNQAWKTDFPSFDQVMPALTTEVRHSGHYASWLEFRLFMDSVFAGISNVVVEAMHNAGGDICTGQPNWTWMAPTTGIDPAKIVPLRTGSQDYGPNAFVRSFKQRNAPVISWQGYAGTYGKLKERLWNSLNRGATGVMLYATFQNAEEGGEGYLTTQGRLSAHGRELRSALRPLTGGLGDLVNQSERLPMPVTMLYVHGGMGIAWLESKDKTPFAWSRRGSRDVDAYNNWFRSYEQWEKIWQALCLGFDYTSEERLKERLETARVLVLPMCYALSDRSRQTILDFQRRGGLVIGDLNTGLFYEDGRPAGTAFMKQAFEVEPMGKPDWRHSAISLDGCHTELVRGTQLRRHPKQFFGKFEDGLPVLLLTRREQGYGLYLNSLPDVNSLPLVSFLRNVMKTSIQLKSPFRLLRLKDGQSPTGMTSSVFCADGDSKDRLAVFTGHPYDNGAPMQGCSGKNPQPETEVILRLAKEHFFYDSLCPGRKPQYSTCVSWNPAKEGPKVFFITEKRQAPPNIQMKKKQFHRGDIVSVESRISSKRILRRQIRLSNGRELWAYARNSALTSCWQDSFGIDLQAPSGEWILTVTDAATGLSAEQRFEILP